MVLMLVSRLVGLLSLAMARGGEARLVADATDRQAEAR